MSNKVKEMIKKGERPLGTFFSLGSTSTMECLGYTGVDYAIIDMEHSSIDKDKCTDLIRAAELGGVTPFTRIADVSHSEIQKAIDAGSRGLIVPCIRTVDEVKAAVSYAKFTPIGNRGFGPVRCDGWGAMSGKLGLAGFMSYCNDNVLVLPQCETRECLENIEEIARLDGVDGIFIGPFDLSISLGVPRKFDDPIFKDALERILKACRDAGKFSFVFVVNVNAAKERFAQGFDSVACGVDSMILIDTYKKIVAEIK
ncbi:MAG: aldolase/citrate lyase family protein [Eubacteriales bacterium]|nr:aldolase/citrate lyase family protein [Eubacteriales bacterium]MDD4390538.1 aldolase/citrate lyase family protein [Eubacteriales bacterium]